MRLCDATAARGAALVDAEGETVDYAGCLEPFEIRVVAAEWRLMLAALAEQPTLSEGAQEILYRGSKRSFAVVSMQDGYALVIELSRTSLRLSPRAISEALRTLALEAGLPNNPTPPGSMSGVTRTGGALRRFGFRAGGGQLSCWVALPSRNQDIAPSAIAAASGTAPN
jgi:hypothetical protein